MSNSNASWMDNVLDALRSPGAMMVALVLALFPQGEHTAQVFAFFSHNAEGSAQFFSYAFAAAVEVAVLLFVLAGHKRISYLFAVASFLTNVVYYAIGGVAMLTVSVLPVLLLSALLPACIMGYSHTIAASVDGHTAKPPKPAKVRRWRWQFWRKVPAPAATPAKTPTNAAARSTSTGAATAPHSVNPVGTAKAVGDSSNPTEQASVTSAQPEGAQLARPTKEQRRTQIAEWQLQSPKQVMDAFGVGKRTADEDLAWVRKAAMHVNGVAK